MTFHSRYTPALMSGDALEQLFVQRHDLVDGIVRRLRATTEGAGVRADLLVGPRGIGKSHLVALLHHRITHDDSLRAGLRVAWLPEDDWGVSSYVALLQSALRALAQDVDDAGADAPAPGPDAPDAERAAIDRALRELPDHDPATGTRIAEEALHRGTGERTLLLIIENLDRVFEGLGEEGQAKLRAFLQDWGRAAIVATAPSLFGAVSLRSAPFHGFFATTHLSDLELPDSIELFRRIGAREGDEKLVESLDTPAGRARVRALRHLAGGNHRVHVIFASLLVGRPLEEMVDALLETLDDLTPYYQSRIAELSPLQRRIVEVLVDARGAIPVKEVARRALATQQSISSQLGTLRDLGVVRSERIGRESFHELREPLMRLSIEIKRHRDRPIRVLVEMLCAWYGREDLEDEGAHQTDPFVVAEAAAAYRAEALALLDAGLNPRLEAALHDLAHASDVSTAGDALRERYRADLGDGDAWGSAMRIAARLASSLVEGSPSSVAPGALLLLLRPLFDVLHEREEASHLPFAVLGPLILGPSRAHFLERYADLWLETWTSLASDAGVATGLRLGSAAFAHLKGDERALMALAREERDFLVTMLERIDEVSRTIAARAEGRGSDGADP